MKKHRMEQAAKLLRETDTSIAENARQIGYDSKADLQQRLKSIAENSQEITEAVD